jgi:hypothetical protein
MIKTHTVTGLKYLCQTKRTDYNTYSGSGVYWQKHLKKHGYTFTTELIAECNSLHELKERGTYFSNLWNIVESDEWANLIIEDGTGSTMSPEIRKRAMETMRRNGTHPSNKSIIEKINATKKINGTLAPSPETIAKVHEARRKNGTTFASPDVQAKVRATKEANGTLNSNSLESIEKAKSTRLMNDTLLSNPEVQAKARATKTANGTLPSSPELNAKRNETFKRNKSGNYCKLTCQHCGKTVAKPAFCRAHGDRCKLFSSLKLDI